MDRRKIEELIRDNQEKENQKLIAEAIKVELNKLDSFILSQLNANDSLSSYEIKEQERLLGCFSRAKDNPNLLQVEKDKLNSYMILFTKNIQNPESSTAAKLRQYIIASTQAKNSGTLQSWLSNSFSIDDQINLLSYFEENKSNSFLTELEKENLAQQIKALTANITSNNTKSNKTTDTPSNKEIANPEAPNQAKEDFKTPSATSGILGFIRGLINRFMNYFQASKPEVQIQFKVALLHKSKKTK